MGVPCTASDAGSMAAIRPGSQSTAGVSEATESSIVRFRSAAISPSRSRSSSRAAARLRVIAGAQVEGEARLARYDVARARLDANLADRRDEMRIGIASRDLFDGQNRFRRAGERVAAHLHRHRAGMAGEPRRP